MLNENENENDMFELQPKDRNTPAAHAFEPGWAYTLLVAIVCVVVATALIGITYSSSLENHKQYATGAKYIATGYVVHAEKKYKPYGSKKQDPRVSYFVELHLDKTLPNGQNVFVSHEGRDYAAVSRFENKPDEKVRFTFSPDGFVADAQKIS